MCVCVSHQQDPLRLDHHGPGSRVQDKRLHKVVLGNVDKRRLHAGSKDDLFGLFWTWNTHTHTHTHAPEIYGVNLTTLKQSKIIKIQ